MSSYGAKFAKCPFYREEGNNFIRCEGYQEGMDITVRFSDPEEYHLYRGGLCRSLRHFFECPMAQMLTREFEENQFGS